MTGLEFIENINYVDDDLVFEAENWARSKARRIRHTVGAGILAACLCLTVGSAINLAKEKNDPLDEDSLVGCPLIPGSDEIYPTVMVNGTLYEWLFGKANLDELHVGRV